MTVVTDMTVSVMTFGYGWIFIYEDGVYWRRVIAGNQVDYDWAIILCRYECLHFCVYSGVQSGVVIDVVFFRNAARFVP